MEVRRGDDTEVRRGQDNTGGGETWLPFLGSKSLKRAGVSAGMEATDGLMA